MRMNTIEKFINSEKLKISYLQSGDIAKISYDNTMLNMYPGTMLDGSMHNIYLKVGNEFTKLIGIHSPSSFGYNDNQLVYTGEFLDIKYKVVYTLFDATYFVDVILEGNKENVSVYYGLDIGLANTGLNEAYNAQYIDHKVIERDGSYVVLSKQNQGRPLLLESGSLNELDSYSTDGFQFFGLSYKKTNLPEVLHEEHLKNTNYQYELAYLAFKTKTTNIDGEYKVTFYHHVQDNYTTFPTKVCDFDEIKKLYETVSYNKELTLNEKVEFKYNLNHTYTSSSFEDKEVDILFKNRTNEEYIDNRLASFFVDNAHVVLKAKEMYVERPTGMVFAGNGFKEISQSPFAFTTYMHGVFASHIVLGNTDFNSFTQESKTPLNILKSQGMRILVKMDNDYRLLTLPAAYKMNYNGATWYYKFGKDLLTITSAIAYNENKIEIEINSKLGIKYDFIITNYLLMSNAEPRVVNGNNEMTFYFNEGTMPYGKYNNFHYTYKSVNNDLNVIGDSYFFKNVEEDNYPLLIQKVDNASNVKLMITADYDEVKEYEYEDINELINNYTKEFRNNIDNISMKSSDESLGKINEIIPWYVQNALIHYSTPHGLEQFAGAAWGCRDVLQGPVELFLTFGVFGIARDIIKKVYSRQFLHNYDWPQWFMFDEYKNIQAGDSHGDIIVWPIKALAQYIEKTNDLTILDEVVPYFNFHLGEYSDRNETIFEHLLNEVRTIEASYVEGTTLPSYGGGDWDDTLQPKNHAQTKTMVSGWTVALLLDGLKTLLNELKGSKYDLEYLTKIYNEVYKDFNKEVVKDGIISGFIYLHDDKKDYMLHPADTMTGIKYRLLPLTRSMIGEIIDEKTVNNYLGIIDKHLMHADGVRLMSSAIKYRGGENTLFMRAETSSCFGREIGLNYIHAHIRYIEAMAHIGNAARAKDGIDKIVPINLNKYVKNALPRQSNVYFSSSDGAFLNRYEAYENFDKLRDGSVGVKAGWRLYSSGPGILLHQIVAHYLGINYYHGDLLLDPVVTKDSDKLEITMRVFDKNVTLRYHAQNKGINKVVVGDKVYNTTSVNRYRKNGIVIPRNEIEENAVIDIYC